MEWKLHFQTNPLNLTTFLSEQCSFCAFDKHCFMRNNEYWHEKTVQMQQKLHFEINQVNIWPFSVNDAVFVYLTNQKIKDPTLNECTQPPAGREASGSARPLTWFCLEIASFFILFSTITEAHSYQFANLMCPFSRGHFTFRMGHKDPSGLHLTSKRFLKRKFIYFNSKW